jgi:hypothetical protein
MKSICKAVFFIGLILTISGALSGSAFADTINYNDIIDDTVFDNTTTMNAAQIDSFLNTFSSSCISAHNGFKSPDPTGYSPDTGFRFGPNVSAGTVIYHAAQAYDMNPQVLLATLQKEQSLVTGTAGCYPNTPDKNTATPCNLYNNGKVYNCTGACPYGGGCIPIAVGYGCPGKCNADQEGFSNQIIRAAWRLSFDRHRAEGQMNWYVLKTNWDNSDDADSCYSGPMTQGTYAICPSGAASYYDGYYTISGTSVHMDNGATAALYHYTPFLHGQALFFSNFTNWFGTTLSSYLLRSTSNSTVYLVSDDTKYPIPSMDIVNALYPLGKIEFVDSAYLNNLTTGGTMSRLIKGPDATLYFFDSGIKLPFTSCTMVSAYGLSCSSPIVLNQFQINKLVAGPNMTNVMKLKAAGTYGISGGTKKESFDSTALTQSGFTAGSNTLSDSSLDYLPYGSPLLRDNVKVTNSGDGSVGVYSSNSLYVLPTGLKNLATFNVLPSGTLHSQSLAFLTKTSLTGLETDGVTNYMLVDKGKATISNAADWSVTFQTLPSGLLGSLAAAGTYSQSTFYKASQGSASVYNVRAIKKYPVASWTDLELLAASNNPAVVGIPGYYLDLLTTGTVQFGPTRLIKSSGSKTVYMIDGQLSKRTLGTFAPITGAGLSTQVVTVPDSTLNAHTTLSGNASQLINCGGTDYIATGGSLKTIDNTIATRYGFTSGRFVSYDSLTCSDLHKQGAFMATFLRATDAKTIFYIDSGVKHPVSSMSEYATLGGSSSNTVVVESPLLAEVPTGSVL